MLALIHIAATSKAQLESGMVIRVTWMLIENTLPHYPNHGMYAVFYSITKKCIGADDRMKLNIPSTVFIANVVFLSPKQVLIETPHQLGYLLYTTPIRVRTFKYYV